MQKKGFGMVKKGSEDGYTQVRTWVFGFVSFVATMGTLLSSILLFSIGPVQRIARDNHELLIEHKSKLNELERRVQDNEELVEAVNEIAGSLREIKKDIEYLRATQ